ncbi:MAG: hypothetical protein ACI97B_002836, partial [Verrucomicrobiales bacterium]
SSSWCRLSIRLAEVNPAKVLATETIISPPGNPYRKSH